MCVQRSDLVCKVSEDIENLDISKTDCSEKIRSLQIESEFSNTLEKFEKNTSSIYVDSNYSMIQYFLSSFLSWHFMFMTCMSIY